MCWKFYKLLMIGNPRQTILHIQTRGVGGMGRWGDGIFGNPGVKVLLSSGYSINGQAAEILERGCKGFIQKPFNMKTLSQKLRKILDSKLA